ncbi:vcsC2 domain protein, partial [Vibrio parahaemolyticus EKP-028]
GELSWRSIINCSSHYEHWAIH